MLRIRTGARAGLRWGVFGFLAAVLAAVVVSSSSSALAAPYADIVIDGNSGAVLHATNPDAQRHPASLTKIMTLYLLFEQLETGKLKLDTALNVSQEAAGQSPTKLGLRPGSTLQVEDAIKGMVTRSANDAAVVVAEAIAGDEDDFAKLMTRKARALGMTRTVYKNASGLPDDDQVTTARDQSILGRAIQERFPRYYKYFSIQSFTFRGQSIANHNHLLGRVEGVDGIKTGYIGASGFNLVTSVHRGNRYLVAVVMGGSSAGSRDARMRELISEQITVASTKRTAPMIAEAGAPPPAPEPKLAAKAEPKPASKPSVAKAEPDAEGKTGPRFAVASAISVPMRFTPPTAGASCGFTRRAVDDGRPCHIGLDGSDPAGSGENRLCPGGSARARARAAAGCFGRSRACADGDTERAHHLCGGTGDDGKTGTVAAPAFRIACVGGVTTNAVLERGRREEACCPQRLVDSGGRLSGRAGGEAAPVGGEEQGSQNPDRRGFVHRADRKRRHYLLSRALCRLRQGQGRSGLQVSQTQRRRVRNDQELIRWLTQRLNRTGRIRLNKTLNGASAKAHPSPR